MMQLNMGTWRGSVAIVCFLAMLIGCTGCGTGGDRQDTQQQTESAGSDASKTKSRIRYRITSISFLIWTPNPIPNIP